MNTPTLLSVNNYHYARGGAEVVFLEHNRLAAMAGWKVVPFAMHHPDNIPSPWSPFFVDELEFGAAYSLVGKLKRATKVVYSLEAKNKIGKLIKRAQPDIAHLHNIYHHLSPSILTTLHSMNVPTIMTLHDLKLACPSYKMLASDGICERCKNNHLFNVVRHRCIKNSLSLSTLVYLESKLHRVLDIYAKNVNKFVVPSRFLLQKLVEWGLSRVQLEYIPNFVDVTQFSATGELGDRFTYVGRLAPEKGVATLIQAALQANVPLRIIGVGPELSSLRQMAAHVDVEFLGYLTGPELHEAVRTSRAVVLPSEWYENCPVSILEASALGVPIIGANIGGLPELIVDGITGSLFESGSIRDLADTLRRFKSCSTPKLTAMGCAARDYVETNFNPTSYMQNISNLYAQYVA